MNDSTRRFFNKDFIIEKKLSFSSVIILEDIYHWVLSKNPPKSINIDDKTFYYISQTHFAEFNNGLLSQPRINAIFKELKKVGIICESVLINRSMNYISFDWNVIKQSLLRKEVLKDMDDNEWWKRIHDYADFQIAKENRKEYDPENMLNKGYEIVIKNKRKYLVKKIEKKSYNKNSMDDMLLTKEDMGIKPKVCKEADAIARLILNRYCRFFSHRIPENGQAPTKTYIGICNKITDIYNGAFLKSRIYPIGEKCLKNSQFKTEGWRGEIKAVQGDWNQTRRLILRALKNFALMHEENRMPYSKEYLQTNLNLWFYDNISNRDEPQSQFLLCLFEPEFTTKHQSEMKADKIFETLNDTAKKGGNKLFELNENMSAGIFWQRVKEMVDWGKLAFKSEPNIQYWVTTPNEIPGRFADYCEEKGISISTYTLDIRKAVDDNSPWTWFIKDMSLKHGLNPHLAECVTSDDFLNRYGGIDEGIIY